MTTSAKIKSATTTTGKTPASVLARKAMRHHGCANPAPAKSLQVHHKQSPQAATMFSTSTSTLSETTTKARYDIYDTTKMTNAMRRQQHKHAAPSPSPSSSPSSGSSLLCESTSMLSSPSSSTCSSITATEAASASESAINLNQNQIHNNHRYSPRHLGSNKLLSQQDKKTRYVDNKSNLGPRNKCTGDVSGDNALCAAPESLVAGANGVSEWTSFDPYSIYDADDLDVDADYDDNDDDDVWYSDARLIEDHFGEVKSKWHSIDDEIWAKIICMEGNRRVAKAYARNTSILIDSGCNGYVDGAILGLNSFQNERRDAKTTAVKRQIGDGVRVHIAASGDIFVTRLTNCAVFCLQKLRQDFFHSSQLSSYSNSTNSCPNDCCGCCSTSQSQSPASSSDWRNRKRKLVAAPKTCALITTSSTSTSSSNNSNTQWQSLRRWKAQSLPLRVPAPLFNMAKFKAKLRAALATGSPSLETRAQLQAQCITVLSFGVADERNLLNLPSWLLVINIVALDLLKATLETVAQAQLSSPAKASHSIYKQQPQLKSTNCGVPCLESLGSLEYFEQLRREDTHCNNRGGRFIYPKLQHCINKNNQKSPKVGAKPSNDACLQRRPRHVSQSPPLPVQPPPPNMSASVQQKASANLLLVSPLGLGRSADDNASENQDYQDQCDLITEQQLLRPKKFDFASVSYVDAKGNCTLIKAPSEPLTSPALVDGLIPAHAQLAPPETQRTILGLLKSVSASSSSSSSSPSKVLNSSKANLSSPQLSEKNNMKADDKKHTSNATNKLSSGESSARIVAQQAAMAAAARQLRPLPGVPQLDVDVTQEHSFFKSNAKLTTSSLQQEPLSPNRHCDANAELNYYKGYGAKFVRRAPFSRR